MANTSGSEPLHQATLCHNFNGNFPTALRLRVGEVYRDLDGALVELLKCEEGVCCYVPLDRGWNDRQYTHRENFQKRFAPFRPSA